jgi:phosphoenolpyruvate carboxylase
MLISQTVSNVSMEVNPLYNALDDLQSRTDVLRGYL